MDRMHAAPSHVWMDAQASAAWLFALANVRRLRCRVPVGRQPHRPYKTWRAHSVHLSPLIHAPNITSRQSFFNLVLQIYLYIYGRIGPTSSLFRVFYHKRTWMVRLETEFFLWIHLFIIEILKIILWSYTKWFSTNSLVSFVIWYLILLR